MFKSLQFGKPKNPGFGISKNFYLTVLAARAPLPAIFDIVNPKGEDGGVQGFGVPLSESATKHDLMMPLQRGAYALATKDRKTVIRCLILSKEEAGFDPEAFANSVLAAFATPELVNRIRATWSLVQLSFETHDAMVAPSMSFLMDLSKRFAQTTDGVVADPICRRYFLPEEIIPDPNHGEIDAVLHLAVSTQPEGPNIRAYTLGLQKFGLPEFEVAELEESQGPMAEAFLLSLGQSHLNGRIAGIGDRVGSKTKPFEVCQGGLDRKIWDGIACFELLPPRGVTANDALAEWARESAAN